MTAIAACSRSAGGEAEDLHPHRARLDRQIPRDRRGGRERSTATARCSTARSSRSTTRAIPASPRSSRRSREGGRGLTLFLFDALEIDGEKLEKLPNIERKQRLAALLGEGRAALHPLCRPYRRQGRATVRGDVRGRPGRDHLQEGRRALSPRPHQELAQGQMHPAAGIRDHRLERRATRRAAASGRCCSALNEDGKLRYAGKVGTGFSMAVQHELRAQLDKLAADEGPGRGAPRRGARRALGEARAGRRDRLRRVHRRQCRAPRQLPRPARRQAGEGGGRRNAAAAARRPPRTTSGSATPTGSSSPTPRSPRASSPLITDAVGAPMLVWTAQPADQPGPLPAGPRQEMLLPEA